MISKLIQERRTVHSYLNEEVPLDILKQAFELASYAPNHKLTFPFLFVTVGNECRKKIADIAFELKGNKEPIRNKFLNEGSLIFFVQKLSDDDFTRKEDYATMACAIQNFSLFMWEQGYGTKWSSGPIIRDTRTYTALNISSKENEIVGMLWAGKFKSAPKTPPRPNIENFILTTD